MAKGNISKRKVGLKPPHEVVLIVCEGKAEKHYFTKYKDALKTFGIHIKAISDDHTDPAGIVKDAMKQKKKEKPEHTWCLFDRDANNQQQLSEAERLAETKGIRIAFSNPCFEIWYLLHFRYSSSPFENCGALERELRQIPAMADYQKERCCFQTLYPKVKDAIRHAEDLIEMHQGLNMPQYSLNSNPSTNVHELIQLLESKRK